MDTVQEIVVVRPQPLLCVIAIAIRHSSVREGVTTMNFAPQKNY